MTETLPLVPVHRTKSVVLPSTEPVAPHVAPSNWQEAEVDLWLASLSLSPSAYFLCKALLVGFDGKKLLSLNTSQLQILLSDEDAELFEKGLLHLKIRNEIQEM